MVISTFRPEYGSDLHWLLGWGERLKLHLQSQEPSDCSNLTFRPDSHALTAMSNFSVKYAYNIETIDRFLKQTNRWLALNLVLLDKTGAENHDVFFKFVVLSNKSFRG